MNFSSKNKIKKKYSEKELIEIQKFHNASENEKTTAVSKRIKIDQPYLSKSQYSFLITHQIIKLLSKKDKL